MGQLRPSRRAAGFTLLELMTVVAIIGTLAAIAIPAFVKYLRKAKTAEVMVNLETVSALERAYRVDHGTYLACPHNPKKLTCKGKSMELKRPWDTTPAWEALGFHPDGQLYYRYRVTLTKTGFAAEATADLDCNGKRSRYVITERGALIIKDEIE
jgi:prepilin-type N-terminal cleavage/methylation domain-containing protein